LTTFDPITGARLGSPTFEADTLQSYELGFRGETRARTFSVDASAYHIDWNDIVVSGIRNGLNTYVNAPGAKVDGGELTLTARPIPTFTVSGAFAFQHARLTAAAPDLGARKGERLPNVPRFTAAINADYRVSDASLRPTFGGTLRFVSDRKAGFDANAQIPQYDLGDYVAADVRAGASFGPVEAQVFVRNLFDVRGALSAYTVLSSLGGPARVAVLQPRTIGVGLTGRF
jgi:outer membrane receptor protein involved in Fe transport